MEVFLSLSNTLFSKTMGAICHCPALYKIQGLSYIFLLTLNTRYIKFDKRKSIKKTVVKKFKS